MGQGGPLIMSTLVGAISYTIGAGAFFILVLLLLASWRGRLPGGLLLLASAGMVVWAGVNAWYLAYGNLSLGWIWTLEAVHVSLWLLFLWCLLPRDLTADRIGRGLLYLACGLGGVLILSAWGGFWLHSGWLRSPFPKLQIMGQLLLVLAGLTAVEQLYRNTRPDKRWYIKFLCLALGGLFAYEFYLYADALLFRRFNPDLWAARGLIAALLVPLLAVTAARNPTWSVETFVSRDVVFHSAAVVGAGLYLLVMASAGYYVRFYGGEWGRVLQVTFLVGAFLLLLVLLFSGQMRARLRVFLNKHFFNYRYDYRKEWLRITEALSEPNDRSPLGERVIRALADLVESPAGSLWIKSDSGRYLHRDDWGEPQGEIPWLEAQDPVLRFMQRHGWVIDFEELSRLPELYEGLPVPEWLRQRPNAWLLIPLFCGAELWGVVLLERPRARFDCNWEVIDILKTAGRQAAGFLALEETSRRLLEARQFEGFNRLAAFVVHDLKNLIAQLSLVVRNADRHAGNPEFVRDAMNTVEHAVGKMERLLSQLKNMGAEKRREKVSLPLMLQEVSAARASQLPRPQFRNRARRELFVLAQPDRLASAFEHIVQNAQEAAGKNGWVRVSLLDQGDQAIVEVEDNGCGMDADFVRRRLFKPFETTKGLSGMGIGAYESREYIREIGGDLTVDSVPGKGSCFRFILPLAVDVSEERNDGRVTA